jgi:hypothetical protein
MARGYEMKTTESRAEVFLMALESLSKAERKAVLVRLLADEEFRQDILDLSVIQQRINEPSRPFREYLAEKKRGS